MDELREENDFIDSDDDDFPDTSSPTRDDHKNATRGNSGRQTASGVNGRRGMALDVATAVVKKYDQGKFLAANMVLSGDDPEIVRRIWEMDQQELGILSGHITRLYGMSNLKRTPFTDEEFDALKLVHLMDKHLFEDKRELGDKTIQYITPNNARGVLMGIKGVVANMEKSTDVAVAVDFMSNQYMIPMEGQAEHYRAVAKILHDIRNIQESLDLKFVDNGKFDEELIRMTNICVVYSTVTRGSRIATQKVCGHQLASLDSEMRAFAMQAADAITSQNDIRFDCTEANKWDWFYVHLATNKSLAVLRRSIKSCPPEPVQELKRNRESVKADYISSLAKAIAPAVAKGKDAAAVLSKIGMNVEIPLFGRHKISEIRNIVAVERLIKCAKVSEQDITLIVEGQNAPKLCKFLVAMKYKMKLVMKTDTIVDLPRGVEDYDDKKKYKNLVVYSTPTTDQQGIEQFDYQIGLARHWICEKKALFVGVTLMASTRGSIEVHNELLDEYDEDSYTEPDKKLTGMYLSLDPISCSYMLLYTSQSSSEISEEDLKASYLGTTSIIAAALSNVMYMLCYGTRLYYQRDKKGKMIVKRESAWTKALRNHMLYKMRTKKLGKKAEKSESVFSKYKVKAPEEEMDMDDSKFFGTIDERIENRKAEVEEDKVPRPSKPAKRGATELETDKVKKRNDQIKSIKYVLNASGNKPVRAWRNGIWVTEDEKMILYIKPGEDRGFYFLVEGLSAITPDAMQKSLVDEAKVETNDTRIRDEIFKLAKNLASGDKRTKELLASKVVIREAPSVVEVMKD